MPGIPGADLISGGIGLGEEVIGLINQGKAKHEADVLARSRPKYQTSPEISQDLSLAESDLANGGSSAASRAYDTLNNQPYSNSIGAILKSGGNVNSIGDLYGNSQDGRVKLAAMRDNLRLQQISNLSRAREAKANEEQTQWQVDQFAPWQDRAQANAASRQGAAQQTSTGINTLGSAAMNAANSVYEKNQLFPKSINNNVGYNTYGYATGVPTGNAAPAISTGAVLPMTDYAYGG